MNQTINSGIKNRKSDIPEPAARDRLLPPRCGFTVFTKPVFQFLTTGAEKCG